MYGQYVYKSDSFQGLGHQLLDSYVVIGIESMQFFIWCVYTTGTSPQKEQLLEYLIQKRKF